MNCAVFDKQVLGQMVEPIWACGQDELSRLVLASYGFWTTWRRASTEQHSLPANGLH